MAEKPLTKIAQRNDGVSDADLEVAIKLDSEGKTVPDSLKAALEAWKAENKGGAGGQPGADDKPKPDTKPEDEIDPEKPEGENGEDDDDGEDDGEDAGGDDKPPVGGNHQRPVKYLPIAEGIQLKKDKQALETQVAELTEALKKASEKKTPEEVAVEMKAIAEETGLTEVTLDKIIKLAQKGMSLPADVLKKIEQIGQPSEEEKQKQFWAEQDKKFDEEFNREVASAGNDGAAMKEHKEKIKELAFLPANVGRSTWEIYQRLVKPKVSKKGAGPESAGGAGGGASGGDKDWAEIAKDPAKMKALSLADKEKMTEWMGKNSSSHIRHAGRKL